MDQQPDMSTIAGVMLARHQIAERARAEARRQPPVAPQVDRAPAAPHVPSQAFIDEVVYQLEHNRAPVPAARPISLPVESAPRPSVVAQKFEEVTPTRFPLLEKPGYGYSQEAHGALFSSPAAYELFLRAQ